MISKVRSAIRVDWTIPAPWLVAILITVSVNLGFLIWKGSAIITKLEHLIEDQAVDRNLIGQIREHQNKDDVIHAKQEQILSDYMVRLEIHARRLEELEKHLPVLQLSPPVKFRQQESRDGQR